MVKNKVQLKKCWRHIWWNCLQIYWCTKYPKIVKYFSVMECWMCSDFQIFSFLPLATSSLLASSLLIWGQSMLVVWDKKARNELISEINLLSACLQIHPPLPAIWRRATAIQARLYLPEKVTYLLAKMTYLLIKGNKRKSLRLEDMRAEKISRIFQLCLISQYN